MEYCCSRRKKVALLLAVSLLVTVFHSLVAELPTETVSAEYAECSDGIDNNHDGVFDYPQDPLCISLHDDNEGPSNRGLFLSVTDNKQTAQPGQTLFYTVSLRTERMDAQQIDVYLQMPHQTNLVDASDGGHQKAELIEWKNISVYPGRVRQLQVQLQVSPHAQENVLLVAEASSGPVIDTDTTRVEKIEIVDETGMAISKQPLLISVTDNVKYTYPGELLKYVIDVHNPTGEYRDFDVRFQVPTDTKVEFVSDQKHRVSRQSVVWPGQSIGPGESRQYGVGLRIENEARDFYTIRVRASVGASIATDTTTVHTGTLPNALTISTSDGLGSTVPGALVTYDVIVKNLSNQLATEVDVRNALPREMEFVDASEGGYWEGTRVRWHNLTVSPHGQRHLQVTGRVRSDVASGVTMRNAVETNGVEAIDQTIVDGVVAGHAINPSQNVMVTKVADRREARPGDRIGYNVTVQNTTNQPLRNLKIEDRIASNLISIRNARRNARIQRNTVAWDVPELQPGEQWTVGYDAYLSDRARHGTVIPNIVTVSGQGMQDVALSQRVHTMEMGVISTLPPTGAAFDMLFLGMTGFAGAGQTLWQRRKWKKRK